MLQTGTGIILYDFFLVKGGAEKVSLNLARELNNTDLCFGSVTGDPRVQDELLGLSYRSLGRVSRNPAFRAFKSIRAFYRKTTFLSQYDWVLYSGSFAPVAVRNHAHGPNLLYCHTLPRFAYDLHDYYLGNVPVWGKPAFKALSAYTRRHYETAVDRMDLILANSENVRGRIRDYLGRDALVVHPPCELDRFTWLGAGEYYLSTARLERYKRVDLIVNAFLRMPEKRLMVASGGSELGRLKALAAGADNIQFTDWVSEERLRELTGYAIATLYIPKDEDFGMSPVESMAAGKPVIGVAEGGLLETIIPGETGLLLDPAFSVEDIVDAVRQLTQKRAIDLRSACEQRAQLFRKELFVEKMRTLIASV